MCSRGEWSAEGFPGGKEGSGKELEEEEERGKGRGKGRGRSSRRRSKYPFLKHKTPSASLIDKHAAAANRSGREWNKAWTLRTPCLMEKFTENTFTHFAN